MRFSQYEIVNFSIFWPYTYWVNIYFFKLVYIENIEDFEFYEQLFLRFSVVKSIEVMPICNKYFFTVYSPTVYSYPSISISIPTRHQIILPSNDIIKYIDKLFTYLHPHMIIFVDIKVGIYQNSSIAKIPMFKTSVPQFFVLMLWRHGFFSSYNNMGDLDDVIFFKLV